MHRGAGGGLSGRKITISCACGSRLPGGNRQAGGGGKDCAACKPRTSHLPCVRGGGFASAKPEGLLCAAKSGGIYFFASTVNPSVSLAADSSPCTGEPGAGEKGEPRSAPDFPHVRVASAGLHREPGRERLVGHVGTAGAKRRRKRAKNSPRRAGNRLFCAGRVYLSALPKGCAHYASPVSGEVDLRQQSRRGCIVPPNRGGICVLRLPSTPQSA